MRPEKQLLLNEIKEKLEQSKALVLARYQKLNPNLSSKFRMVLEKNGSGFEVVRKRILAKAAEASGFTIDLGSLEGHIGIVYTAEDPVQMTKTIYQFAKDNEDVLEVLVGRFEGQYCSAKDVKIIADLPSKEQMRSQFLSVLEAPMAQVLGVVDALLTSPLHCLENKANATEQS